MMTSRPEKVCMKHPRLGKVTWTKGEECPFCIVTEAMAEVRARG